MCVGCPALTANGAGDNAVGADTVCDSGYTLSAGMTCAGNNLDVTSSEHQCYTKCSNAKAAGCNGWKSSYTSTSNALCLDSTGCLAVCTAMDTCFGFDDHATLDRCYLTSLSACSLKGDSDFNEYTKNGSARQKIHNTFKCRVSSTHVLKEVELYKKSILIICAYLHSFVMYIH